MAKYVPMDLLSSLHGKVCGHSNVYFARRGRTLYTGKVCNARTVPFTENELAVQDKFRKAQSAALSALSSATERAQYESAFRKQTKYSTLRGYVFAQEYAKL